MSIRASRVLRAVLVTLSLAAASACVAGHGPAEREPAPATSETSRPQGSAPGGGTSAGPTFALPLARYSFTMAQQSTISAAQDALVHACVRRFGMGEGIPSEGAQQPAMSDRRYGLLDPREAAATGYHLPPRPRTGQQRKMSRDLTLVLYGPQSSAPSVFKGRKLPKGGCAQEAADRLTVPYVYDEGAQAASEIDRQAYQESEEAPPLRAAFSRWSACMKSSGFSYSSPLEAMADKRFLKSGVSALEKSTATADVACKQKVHLEKVWLAVESGKQEALIARKKRVLDRLYAAHRRRVAAADVVLTAEPENG